MTPRSPKREPYTEVHAGKVLSLLVRELGFQQTLSLLVALEREGMRRARIPSARRLRLHVLRQIPRRADLDVFTAELGLTRQTVRYYWRKRHGRSRR
jgi:hypothetical protein